MAQKQIAKPSGIPLELPPNGFKRGMLYNRFVIEPDGEFKVLHFAYVNRANVTVDHFICAIHARDLEFQKVSNLEYLGRLGALSMEAMPGWQPPALQQPIELVNHIGLCQFGNSAELTLHRLSIKSVLDFARSVKPPAPLRADAIALLRSGIELQKHLVAALYSP